MKDILQICFLSFFNFLFFISCGFVPLVKAENISKKGLNFNSEKSYFDQIFNSSTLLETQSIASQIKRKYPPERYYYIFIGRSLSLVKALLETQNIPLTGLPLRGKHIDLTFSSAAGQTTLPIIVEHLNQHLPSNEELNGKQIVLLDFTRSGAGLKTAKKLLHWYYNNTKPLHTLEVTNYPLGFKDHIPWRKEKTKVIRISTNSMMYTHLLNSNFDRYAGYGSFNIESAQYLYYDANTKKNHLDLKDWLINKIINVNPSSTQSIKFCRLYLS